METLKELVLPSNASLLLVAFGLVTGLHPQTRRWSRWLIASGLLLLAVLSSGWTASALLAPLENASQPASFRTGDPPAQAIVVLGAYAIDDPLLPLSSQPNAAALYRAIEALHLRERCPACTVMVTGSAPTVDVMARLLVSLGMPRDSLVLDSLAANTAESARHVAAALGDKRFYLVTSAGHMPRALLAFRLHGQDPLPAPTDHRLPRGFASESLLPSARSLVHSDLAVREYLGILWYGLFGAGGPADG